ncbi:hypothetical protein TSUD_47110 [Trifolium subterraneum]|nr:hypothetical protein TSUD_47110 [Trifolium subterraneum]
MASFKPVFLFAFVCFINLVTTKAKDNSLLWTSCSTINRTTLNSTFELKLMNLLLYLSSNATANKEFYNTTVVAGTNHSSENIYGMFMCKGDVPAQLCSQCVTNSTRLILSADSFCYLSKEYLIWYEDCMIRYSNNSFFSTADISSPSSTCHHVDVPNQAIFKRLVFETLNGVADEAANFSTGIKKYATKEANISEFQTLYFQAQCTPDLSPRDCRKCLNVTLTEIQSCNEGKNVMVGNGEASSCYIRYDVYPFYRPTNAATPSELIPASNTIDSKFSPHPAYLSHNCSSNEIVNNDFLSNLRTLFSSLSSNAIRTGFFKITCLTNIFQNEIPWCCLASPEGKIMYPSCYMIFGLAKFYDDGDEPQAFEQVSPPPTVKGEV